MSLPLRAVSGASLAMAAAALLIGFSLGACGLGRSPDSDGGAISDPVVAAKVNGRPIYTEDVRAYAVSHGLLEEGQDLDANSDAFNNALEALIEVRLFALEAEAHGLDRRPEVRRDLDAARDEVLAGAVYQDIDARANDAQAIERVYRETAPRLSQGEVVHLRHIQFDSKEAADAAKRRLDHGERFEALAFELSTDRVTAADGGDWGVGALTDLQGPLLQIVPHLSVGEVAGPTQIGEGWHLIRLDERTQSGAPPLETLRPQIVRWLQFQEDRRLFERLERNARIERLREPEAGAAPSGEVSVPEDSPATTETPNTTTTAPLRPNASSTPFPFPMGPGGVYGEHAPETTTTMTTTSTTTATTTHPAPHPAPPPAAPPPASPAPQ